VANAGMRGRPIEPLVLCRQERAYLERQVRRHRVARSLSERCRAILQCADGLASKCVATELGIHEHTVGKWRRRFLKDRCDGLLDEARPGRPRTINDDQVAEVIERTLRTTPPRRDALVDPLDGCRNWLFPHHDPPNVDGVRLAAASQPDIQTVERSAVR
jgi:transposase-like protein